MGLLKFIIYSIISSIIFILIFSFFQNPQQIDLIKDKISQIKLNSINEEINITQTKELVYNPKKYQDKIITIRGEPQGVYEFSDYNTYMIFDNDGYSFCVMTKRYLEENRNYYFTGMIKFIDKYSYRYYDYCLVENS